MTINACRDGAQIRVDVHNTGSFIDPIAMVKFALTRAPRLMGLVRHIF